MEHDPTGAPPPPGADSPVPADAAARAAASGRGARLQASAAAPEDRLVPATALEQRAAERAARRRAAPPAWRPAAVANPAAGPWWSGTAPGYAPPPGHAPQPYAHASPQPRYAVPAGHATQPYGYAPPQPGYAPQPGFAPQPGYAPPTGYAPPAGYAPPPYGYAAPPYAYAPPPRIPWTRRQRAAALLGSWLGQTVMSLATHLLVAATLVVGFAALLHASGEGVDEIQGDSLSSAVALWALPERLWATALVVLLVCGTLLAIGWLAQALWQRHEGIAKPHRSTWLAWLCTTAATGLIGSATWPIALFTGLFWLLLSTDASLTTGSMWSLHFGLLAIAVVFSGGVGLLFGWLFLSTSRERVDPVRAAAEAEAAARARDEAELEGTGRHAWPARA
ncbi:hypothetical protein LG314_00855 [Agrococcus terreus]|uniref:hypothetical protein n=1 Tax=Agrococcus terreus TaxID=574649 RepID=UPI00384D17A7